MISNIHVLFSNNKSKVQSHTHNFFLISCTVPMVKIGSRSRFWRRVVFRCYYLVFKGQDLFLIYKTDLTRRNDLFFSVLFISCEFDSVFKKIKIWGIICLDLEILLIFFLQSVLYKKKKTQCWTKTIPMSLPRTQNNHSDITLTNKCYVKEL